VRNDCAALTHMRVRAEFRVRANMERDTTAAGAEESRRDMGEMNCLMVSADTRLLNV
jgi:hypothetical protein